MSLAATAVVAVGPGVAWLTAVSAPSTSALTCAQPVNPTVREVVNDVCKIFGP
jgi:hypothetical protein